MDNIPSFGESPMQKMFHPKLEFKCNWFDPQSNLESLNQNLLRC